VNTRKERIGAKFFWLLCGSVVLPLFWWTMTGLVGVSARFIPPISSVLMAWSRVDPPIWVHASYTLSRLLIGFLVGTLFGFFIALLMASSARIHALMTPAIQSLRAVPAAACVPFFLLWFGFSEWGRYLLVVLAVAFNVAVAARQILEDHSSAHRAFFASFGILPGHLPLRYGLPKILEGILPTLRYSMALAIGAVTVSELLGSQVGLGYLIQTARLTFSLDLLFLAMIGLGALSAASDALLQATWSLVVFWKESP
jgi:ABC-type nitrate/sulfonate/bicarbonate transport system permease component